MTQSAVLSQDRGPQQDRSGQKGANHNTNFMTKAMESLTTYAFCTEYVTICMQLSNICQSSIYDWQMLACCGMRNSHMQEQPIPLKKQQQPIKHCANDHSNKQQPQVKNFDYIYHNFLLFYCTSESLRHEVMKKYENRCILKKHNLVRNSSDRVQTFV